MSTLVGRLSSRLLSTDDAKWNHPRIVKMLMTILTPILLISGCGISLVAQHSVIFGEIPPIIFGIATVLIEFILLALINYVLSG